MKKISVIILCVMAMSCQSKLERLEKKQNELFGEMAQLPCYKQLAAQYTMKPQDYEACQEQLRKLQAEFSDVSNQIIQTEWDKLVNKK